VIAVCSGNPTSFQWTNCQGSSSLCTASSSTAGTQTYSVRASNSFGTGQSASGTANWQAQQSTSVPVCTVSPATSTQTVGSNDVVTAVCTGSPTSFAWTGCNSNAATCTANESAIGSKNYSVVASNAVGPSAAASTTITWQAPSAPVCTLGASTLSPTINSTLSLNASCSGNPTSYTWTNCSSSGANCSTSASTTGTVTYSVKATNAVGTSAASTVSVNWQSLPTVGNSCDSYRSVVYVDLPWQTAARGLTGNFGNFTAVVGRFTVPAGAKPSQTSLGRLVAAEYQGQGTPRWSKLSTAPCDFSSSESATLFNSGGGYTVTYSFQVGGSQQPYVVLLQPGATYYLNIRNSDEAGNPTCAENYCNMFIDLITPNGS